jgi:hypothetical protein
MNEWMVDGWMNVHSSGLPYTMDPWTMARPCHASRGDSHVFSSRSKSTDSFSLLSFPYSSMTLR